jgi:hypothetical protein
MDTRIEFVRIGVLRTWLRRKIDLANVNIINLELYRVGNEFLAIIYSLSRFDVNKYKIEKEILARFNIVLKIEFRSIQKTDDTIIYRLIKSLYNNSLNNLPKAISNKVVKFCSTLNTLNSLKGYVIFVSGKIRGTKHSVKKIEYGCNKYTGSYLNKYLILKTLHIPTRQGVVGIKIRILYNQALPGKFKLKYEQET